MKTLRTRFFSLILGFFMLIGVLTGCALIVPSKSEALKADALKVGNTTLTKQEISDLWYSFSNENSSYFYMYDNDSIMDAFYKNIIAKYAIIEKTNALIEDNVLEYSEGDDAKVWLQVFESIASSVNTKEKALLLEQGVEEDELPTRLASSSSSSDDVKSYKYEDYSFEGMKDYVCKYLVSTNTGDALTYEVGKDVAASRVNDMIRTFATYLTLEEVETEDEVDYVSIADLKAKFENTAYYTVIDEESQKTRDVAYQMFISNLLLSNKSKGISKSQEQTLFDMVKNLYVSYYETYLYNMYQSYVKSLITDETSDYYYLSNSTILARYLQLLGKNIQNYNTEENYITVVESSATEALLLYHFNGEYYYFSVRHLLVKFDGDVTAALAEIPGKNSESSTDQYAIYELIRKNFFENLKDEDNNTLTSWEDYKNVTYRDENGYDVYDFEGKEVFYDADYKVVKDENKTDAEQLTKYYYVGTDDEPVHLTQDEFDTCTLAKVKVSDVLASFNTTYNQTLAVLEANKTNSDLEAVQTLLKKNENIDFVISTDLISQYQSATTSTINSVKYRIFSNLFMQLTFKYSADSASLGSDLSDFVGMIISNRPDNNKVGGSSYVSEFTNGARELVQQYVAGDASVLNSLTAEKNFYISDYGIHMIVINDVYSAGSVTPGITYDAIYGTTPTLTEDEAINILKETYITASSSQTIYEFIYDIIRDELVGSSGRLFTIERNKIYNEYVENNKVEYINKMSYEELNNSIGS